MRNIFRQREKNARYYIKEQSENKRTLRHLKKNSQSQKLPEVEQKRYKMDTRREKQTKIYTVHIHMCKNDTYYLNI